MCALQKEAATINLDVAQFPKEMLILQRNMMDFFMPKIYHIFSSLNAVLLPEAHCLNFANSHSFAAQRSGRYHIFGQNPFWLSGKGGDVPHSSL